MSRLPLALPLLDRDPVVVAAAVPVGLEGKDILAMLLIANVSTLLLMINNC